MKAKTIRQVLRRRLNLWLESIEDENLRTLVRSNTIITGGCITSMLLNETVSDYDIYFTDRETVYKVADYYIKRFKPKNQYGINQEILITNEYGSKTDLSESGRIKIMVRSAGIASEDGTEKPYQYFEMNSKASDANDYVSDVMEGTTDNPEEIVDLEDDIKEALSTSTAYTSESKKSLAFRPVFISSNAIMLSNKIQIVIRFWGDAAEIHKNFDYVHCTNYWTSKDDKLTLRPEALECILAKELRYSGSLYPVCSIFRLRKFLSKGWTVNAGQLLKICMQISNLDLTKIDVLRDQLTGVDVAYFMEVIEKLKEKDPVKVNEAYLIEIIDRMF